MGTEIVFWNKKLKNAYESLRRRSAFETLYKALSGAFKDIMGNPAAGIPLEKYRIPKELRSQITNLWKYELPGGWRLIYSLAGNKITIIALILEWCDHKTYEKKYSGKR